MTSLRSKPFLICFGDSLTVGYQSPSIESPVLRETPYGAFLQQRLESDARVVISGVCGELTGDMAARFTRDVVAYGPAYVAILGGSNDLGWNTSPGEIMANLRTMYDQAVAAGIQPIAVTVPSIRVEGSEGAGQEWLNGHIHRRQHLNRSITDHCAVHGLHCVDLFTATAEPGTLRLASQYSNDGLHLTTEGYRTLATLIFDEVFAARFEHPDAATS